MSVSVTYLFPTFAMRREEYTLDGLPGFSAVLQPLVDRAAAVVEISPATFAFPDRTKPLQGLPVTLQSHYACYLEGVAAATWLQPRVGDCDLAAGYSMGFFAALSYAGSVSFEDGLRLMRGLCLAVHDCVRSGAYAMGAIDGLTTEAVAEILVERPGVEVIDIYGNGTTIVSGRDGDVAAVLETCQQHGATYTRLTPVTAPYHSSALRSLQPTLEQLLDTMTLKPPRCRVISALTEQVVVSADDVRTEIAFNVSHAMNWYATMRALLQSGMTALYECGSSAALANMARRDLPDAYAIEGMREVARRLANAP